MQYNQKRTHANIYIPCFFGSALLCASCSVLAQQTDTMDDEQSSRGNVQSHIAAPAPAAPAAVGNASSTARFSTITVKGNRLYSMESSEQSGGYSVDSATVGSKTPALLRDIPQSVDVVTHDAIRDQAFHTLDELGRSTPGVRVLPNDAGRSSIYSRGYEYDNYEIDGLPAPMSSITGSVPQLEAFDRVEMMRGPSGLFDSTSEMGGIVNMVLKKPTRKFQGNVSGSYGSWNHNNIGVDLSGPINQSGSVRGRMVINHEGTNGFVDHNHNKQNLFYGTLAFDLDSATELDLSFLRQQARIHPNNGVSTDTAGNLKNYPRHTYFGADWNRFQSQSNDWIAELTHHFSNGGYGRVAGRYSNRNAYFNYAYGGGTGVSAANRVSVAGLGERVNQNSFSADASYSQPFSTFGHVSEFVVGTDYKHYRTDADQAATQSLTGSQIDYHYFDNLQYVNILNAARGSFLSPYGNKIRYRHTHTITSLDEYGAYGKLTFRPWERLALIAGTRVSAFKQQNNNALTGVNVHHSSNAKVTPYGGFVFDLSDSTSLYASYSQVYDPQTETDAQGSMIKPRTGDQYETGIKSSFMNGRLNSRISLYRMYDKHRAAPLVNNPAAYTALGKTRNQGVELELTGNITPYWSVIAGYTYLNTKVETSGSSNDDAVFTLMPKHMANLWTTYRFHQGPLNHLTVGAGINAVSDFSSSTKNNEVHAPGYAVTNLMAAYDVTPRLRLQMNANNIFNRKYYERVGSKSTFDMYGEPRSIFATATYKL
ncbi:Fe(3+)-pyochelin receptor [Halomonadaceae bacterium LMG 33818]